MRALLFAPLLKFASRLRFRNLFLVTATLFVATVLIPDAIPFADELLLGLATLILSQWKRRGDERKAGAGGAPPRGPIDLPGDQVRRER